MLSGTAIYVDQLKQIFRYLGKPSEDTLRRVSSLYVQDPLMIDLLSQLLQVNFTKRITCEQALEHPCFAVWHDPTDELTSGNVLSSSR